MAHIPVNHPLQPLYRVVVGACGSYVLVFGIAGVTQTRGLSVFAQDGLPRVLGLQANRAFAIVSIIAGVVLVGGAVIGGNADRWINLIGGIVFLGSGFAMMVLLRTELNFLGFTMATCIVSFVIGLVLFTGGLYGKVGTEEDVVREEAFRHGGGPDPNVRHNPAATNPPHGHEKAA